jgi:hypothetical protein
MAEYYEESRNESPNILGIAGLLGLGALAGAGGYYALRNARGKGAAAEALTRAARSERPRGVQMGDLSARVTGDFGYDPRITGNTQLPNRRRARVTGDMGANANPRPVAPHAPEQYSNVPPSIPPTTPTSELRARVYSNVAAKPESELPRVYKPQGGTTEEMLITDPNTGEMYRRGGGGSYFASKVPSATGSVLTDLPFAKVNLDLQDQVTDAIESGAAQQTGRVWQQLSRNEDLDKTQIAQLNAQADADYKAMLGSNPSEWSGVEGDVAINTVAQVLPDGLPIDQAEGIGYALGRTSNADLSQSSAANFLQQRRLKLLEDAEAGTPARLEKKLAEAFGPEAWREDPKATRRRNALKLGAAGNEQFFENLNEGTVTIAGEQFPVSSLKEGVYMEDTAQNLANKVNQYKTWLGDIRLKETSNQIGLANDLDNLMAQDALLQADVANMGSPRKSFSNPQERDEYITASRGREVALDLQDEIDARVNETLRNFEMSERRLLGAEKATGRNIRRAAVPQKLMSGVEEGIVVRPILTEPDNIVANEGELSNLERGRPVGQFISQEQLEVVPGGLLSGGRAKSLVNVGSDLGIDPETGDRILLPNVDVNTGETLVQKLAGKRMGEDVSVRGRGGVAGLDTLSSIGIYGPELAEYGTAAMNKQGEYTPQASRPPSATDTALGVYNVRKYIEDEKNPGGKPVFFSYPSSYEDPEAYKYSQAVTPQGLQSIDLSRAIQATYAKNPRDVADVYTKAGLNKLAQLTGKELPTSTEYAPSTPLYRRVSQGSSYIDDETGQRVVVPPQYASNRPVPVTEETTGAPLEPIQLSFRSDVVPSVPRTRVTEADAYANQLANYVAKMQKGQTGATSSPVVIQPNLVVSEEYQLPLAFSAGVPTPQIQGPMRATSQLRGFEAPVQYIETYQPTLFTTPTETRALQNPVANLTLRERNVENRLQRIREDISNRQQRRLAGGI